MLLPEYDGGEGAEYEEDDEGPKLSKLLPLLPSPEPGNEEPLLSGSVFPPNPQAIIIHDGKQ